MTNGAAGASGGTAAVAVMIGEAIKASGAIVQVEPADFENILKRTPEPLVIYNEGGLFSKTYRYLSAYKGIVFHTKSKLPLTLPSGVETVIAKKIWIPSF